VKILNSPAAVSSFKRLPDTIATGSLPGRHQAHRASQNTCLIHHPGIAARGIAMMAVNHFIPTYSLFSVR
jgi:hypothetical protein